MFDISTFSQGLALGLGMFVCPGPKDVLILRQALSRRPAAELIAVGVLSDALLIWLGMAGVSAALSRAPAWRNAALWLGVCMMVGHAILAAGRAARGAVGVEPVAQSAEGMTRGTQLSALLMVSLLNPAAWLDTVLVIGTAGAASPPSGQLSFACGAVAASLTWFLALVTGARLAGQWMTAARTWQALDALVATAMIGLAVYFAAGLF